MTWEILSRDLGIVALMSSLLGQGQYIWRPFVHVVHVKHLSAVDNLRAGHCGCYPGNLVK